MFLKLRATLDADLHPRRWMLFVLAFILVRGLMVLCVLPALEGWDEFQHLGYIDYIDRHVSIPVIGRARMDNAFTTAIDAYPQSANAKSYGARTYHEYWNGIATTMPMLPPEGLLLYEAQHPPGYYWLVLPIYRAMGGVTNLVAIDFVLRVINLLFTVAAAGLFMAAFRELLGPGLAWRWASALLAVHPLFLLTGTRVANDALSLLMAGLVLCLTVRLMRAMRSERLWTWALPSLLGVSLGAAAWTKPTILALFPVAIGGSLLAGWRQQGSALLPRRVVASALALAIFAVISFPFFVRNLMLYHSAVPIVEAVTGGGTKTAADYLAALYVVDWNYHLHRWWAGGSLWIGGWTFLEMPYRVRVLVFEPFFFVGFGLATWRVIRDMRRKNDEPAVRSILLGVCVCVSFTAALMVHAIKTAAYLGFAATCPWYAAAAWPLEMLILAAGFAGISRRWIGKVLCAGFILTCMIAEVEGTLGRMPRAYGDVRSLTVAYARMASIRPAIFGTPTLVVLASAYVMMGAILLLTIAATNGKTSEIGHK